MLVCLCFRMFQPPPKSDNRPVLLMNKPTCSVPPAAQTPKSLVTEVSTAAAPAPVVQQGKWKGTFMYPLNESYICRSFYYFSPNAFSFFLVVCTVATTAPPRLPMHPTAQIAVRASAPKPVLTVRPPTASCTTSIAAHPGPVPGSVLPQRVLLSPDMQARLPCKCRGSFPVSSCLKRRWSWSVLRVNLHWILAVSLI